MAPRVLAMPRIRIVKCMLACLSCLPLLADPAAADDALRDPVQPLAWSDSGDFSELALRIDLESLSFRDRDALSLWTEFATSGRRIGGDELRLDWTPVTDQLISRRNRMASFKPSSGLGFDFDAPSESVVLEWRIGF